MTARIPPPPLAPMSSLLRQGLSWTLTALTSPVQSGSRRNASRATDAA